MSPEKQRIAIAKSRGYIFRECEDGTVFAHDTSRGTGEGYRGLGIESKQLLALLPDYLNDLNAMHEAEKVLTVAQRIAYAFQIGVVLSGGTVGRAIPNWWFIHEATAAQRARAFLETIGKWEDAK